MLKTSKQYSTHFHTSEFKCDCCNNIKISEKLIDNLEILFDKLHASKCIITSGYRCNNYDLEIGGFLGQHNKGYASDCIYYDEFGNMIPSSIVCCVAYDLGIFNGIAKIDYTATHLDIRNKGIYRGDEQRGNDNYWDDPYNYFGISKNDVRKYTKEEIPVDTSNGNDYKTLYNMYVRCGAGYNYGTKLYKELTEDGKKNALDKYDDCYAIYKKGTVFTALDVITNNDNSVWAKTPSGYVVIKGASGTVYCEKL